MITVDLNCDMGEGMGNEELIMPYISSANIACGYHAGNTEIMKQVIELAQKHHVAIGAHPSFRDTANFGRTELHLPLGEIYDLVKEQISIIKKIADELGASIHHVKPHGALYNMAARASKIAAVIALAVKDSDEDLILYGSGRLVTEAGKIGLKSASEVFADRTYQDNGVLTSRKNPDALISDEAKSVQQVLEMVKKGTVTTISGKSIPKKAETICMHGDNENAVALIKAIHATLKNEGIDIRCK